MHSFFRKIQILYTACRGYSIPISFLSWLVPFLYAALNGGNVKYGIISLAGIVILHMGTNIFDDAADYTKEKSEINRGLKKEFNFQKGKCICILQNLISLKQAYIISFSLFFIALITGLFFVYSCGLKILYIIIPSALICMLYPLLGCLGLGEILVSIIFSPLIYSGVYFIMKGNFSADILTVSISTGLLSVAVLHNHMLLDYKYDTQNRKITLCRLCGNEKNALILLIIIVALAYINLVVWFISDRLNYCYLLPLITLPKAVALIKIMNNHINTSEYDPGLNSSAQKNFLLKFLTAQNLLLSFTIVLCISIVISNCIINN